MFVCGSDTLFPYTDYLGEKTLTYVQRHNNNKFLESTQETLLVNYGLVACGHELKNINSHEFLLNIDLDFK